MHPGETRIIALFLIPVLLFSVVDAAPPGDSGGVLLSLEPSVFSARVPTAIYAARCKGGKILCADPFRMENDSPFPLRAEMNVEKEEYYRLTMDETGRVIMPGDSIDCIYSAKRPFFFLRSPYVIEKCADVEVTVERGDR